MNIFTAIGMHKTDEMNLCGPMLREVMTPLCRSLAAKSVAKQTQRSRSQQRERRGFGHARRGQIIANDVERSQLNPQSRMRPGRGECVLYFRLNAVGQGIALPI